MLPQHTGPAAAQTRDQASPGTFRNALKTGESVIDAESSDAQVIRGAHHGVQKRLKIQGFRGPTPVGAELWACAAAKKAFKCRGK
jgi:hypothetical protein